MTVDCTPTVEGVVINGQPRLQVKCGQYIVGDYGTVDACLRALRQRGISLDDLVIKEGSLA